MKPSEDFAAAYPSLAEWIPKGMFTEAGRPRVFKAFCKVGNIPEGSAVKFIAPGSYPEIHSFERTKDHKEDGYHVIGDLKTIHISSKVCAAAERKLARSEGQKTPHKFVRTVLHEMIHWCHDLYGKPEWLRREGGWAFEKRAYGIPGI